MSSTSAGRFGCYVMPVGQDFQSFKMFQIVPERATLCNEVQNKIAMRSVQAQVDLAVV